MQKFIGGIGCFWDETKYEGIPGITSTECGYCGGKSPNVSYKEVCGGDTEHVEVVKVEFDQKIISYEEITRLFFKIHYPTTLNRQGPNIGHQYRSEIFYTTEEEKISLKVLCQGAAIRFLLTRVFDYLNLTEGAIVKIKDPIEYLKRLDFHKNAKKRHY